jgi:ATP-dependent DNA helicase RecQ
VLVTLGSRVAADLGVRYVPLLARVSERPPQREMANAAQQAANVRGAFRIADAPPAGAGVLLDDRRGSGWTLAMVGGQLRKAGAERIVPLALATAF